MYPSPLADTGDCSEGVTTTSIGVIDDPPDIITTTSTCPDDSEPTNLLDPNSTTNSTQHMITDTQEQSLYKSYEHKLSGTTILSCDMIVLLDNVQILVISKKLVNKLHSIGFITSLWLGITQWITNEINNFDTCSINIT